MPYRTMSTSRRESRAARNRRSGSRSIYRDDHDDDDDDDDDDDMDEEMTSKFRRRDRSLRRDASRPRRRRSGKSEQDAIIADLVSQVDDVTKMVRQVVDQQEQLMRGTAVSKSIVGQDSTSKSAISSDDAVLMDDMFRETVREGGMVAGNN